MYTDPWTFCISLNKDSRVTLRLRISFERMDGKKQTTVQESPRGNGRESCGIDKDDAKMDVDQTTPEADHDMHEDKQRGVANVTKQKSASQEDEVVKKERKRQAEVKCGSNKSQSTSSTETSAISSEMEVDEPQASIKQSCHATRSTDDASEMTSRGVAQAKASQRNEQEKIVGKPAGANASTKEVQEKMSEETKTSTGGARAKTSAGTTGATAFPDNTKTKDSTSSDDFAYVSDLDLLLIGKSGVGKSATGNSILGRKVFRSSASLSSVTDKIYSEVTKVNDLVIKVVDGPGVGDTRMDTDEGIKFFVESMKQAMVSNPLGYHAFLLVLRYGCRLTQEDRDTIKLLKEVFGQDFVKKYCIIIVTCGDNFKDDSEDDGYTFTEWLNDQKGLMEELRKECQDRVVLFDNFTRDQKEKLDQIDELLAMIKRLDNKGVRYSDENFEHIRVAREKVLSESKVPLSDDKTVQTVSLLFQEFNEIQKNRETGDYTRTIHDLERFLMKVAVQKKKVEEQDRSTGALHELMDSLKRLETVAKEQIRMLTQHLEENLEDEGKAHVQQADSDSLSQVENKALRASVQILNEKLKQKDEEIKRMHLEIQDNFDQFRVKREVHIFNHIGSFIVDCVVQIATRAKGAFRSLKKIIR